MGGPARLTVEKTRQETLEDTRGLQHMETMREVAAGGRWFVTDTVSSAVSYLLSELALANAEKTKLADRLKVASDKLVDQNNIQAKADRAVRELATERDTSQQLRGEVSTLKAEIVGLREHRNTCTMLERKLKTVEEQLATKSAENNRNAALAQELDKATTANKSLVERLETAERALDAFAKVKTDIADHLVQLAEEMKQRFSVEAESLRHA